jgi:hypothetical protein
MEAAMASEQSAIVVGLWGAVAIFFFGVGTGMLIAGFMSMRERKK